MKTQDIIDQLANRLPLFTDLISDSFNVLSLARSGTTVTITTSTAHKLTNKHSVLIKGAQTPLTVVSLTRVGSTAFLETSSNHDMTLTVPGVVEIDGANEPEFNGVFTVTAIDNRKNIAFSITDSGPTSATGTILVLNGSSALQSYNGRHQVTSTPSTTLFTYEISDATLPTPAEGEITVQANARISGAVEFPRLLDAYTEQDINDLWAFVVLEDTSASKNRALLSDATDNIQRTGYFRQQILQPVSIYLFIPTAIQQIAGRQARDLAEELFRPLCQSILFKKYDSGLFSGLDNPLMFLSHGFHHYDSAVYVHRYTFEQVNELYFEDTVGFDEDVAFRDITLNMGVDIGTAILTADLDLDIEPLP